jgi:ankyrin repeat domain-containing protein 50
MAGENKHDILRWLITTDPALDHAAARAKHQPETGEWFIETDEYLEWRTSPRSFLLLQGIPGCGKSILW